MCKKPAKNTPRDIFKEIREQRKWFKNLRIHHTEISTATDFLEQQWQFKSTTQSKSAGFDMQAMSFNLSPKESLKILEQSEVAGTASKAFKEIDLNWAATIELIIEESGLKADELQDGSSFADLGLDSLFQLRLLDRMREHFAKEFPLALFTDCPTIREFRTFIESGCIAALPLQRPRTPSPISVRSLRTSNPNLSCDVLDVEWSAVIQIIAEEIGAQVDELLDETDFEELGIDSLMALTIAARLREHTNIEFTSTLFMDHPTLRQLRSFVRNGGTVSPAPKKRIPNIGTLAQDAVALSVTKHTEMMVSPPPHQRLASSVLIQGNLTKASKYLWLAPDESGSATSYIDIPDISPNIAVLGLNSPYMKVPEEYKCGIIGMAEAFIVEMKRRQPRGPYILAGWSAGGVIAFEVVNQLTKNGEAVEKLILIDTPCPDVIGSLPSSLHAWFASIGLLSYGDPTKIPTWLLPHFAASVNAISNYTAERIDPQKCPYVTAIWCEDGVCKLPTDPRPDPFPYGHAQFLLDNRTDFGPNMWDRYLNSNRFVSKHMPGNHFTMVERPFVRIHIHVT